MGLQLISVDMFSPVMSSRSPQGGNRQADVLLVESNPDEIAPFIESFESTDRTNEVHVVEDSDDALDFIHRRGDFTAAPRPDLILLDLRVSGTDGEKILTELNEQQELRRTPVIVMTASATAEDVARSYDLNANAYVQKPSTSDEFSQLAQTIEDFWLDLVEIPSN